MKLVSWYDNEWGYSNKVLEMVRVVAKASVEPRWRVSSKRGRPVRPLFFVSLDTSRNAPEGFHTPQHGPFSLP